MAVTAETLRVVDRIAQWAPAAVNPFTSFRGQCSALTIFALSGSVPIVAAAQRPRRSVSALTFGVCGNRPQQAEVDQVHSAHTNEPLRRIHHARLRSKTQLRSHVV